MHHTRNAGAFYITAVFLAKNIFSFVLVTAYTLALIAVSRIPMKIILKGMKPLLLIIAFTAVINVFWTKGDTLLWEFSFIKIYLEGVMFAVLMIVRISALLMGTSVILTYTTSPIALTDGLENPNKGGGNDDSAILAPEFSFDVKSAPMLFVHGDADGWAAMNSVKAWEKLVHMGVHSELHTLATRNHCFQSSSSPGTGSYTHLDRIWEFLTAKGFNK